MKIIKGDIIPTISVITIAKDEKEIYRLKEKLKSQTFNDYELVISTKGTIPEAWNDAIKKSKGKFLVFTESDAIPLNNDWLNDISKYLKKGIILKGIEINPTDLNLCNLVADSDIIKKNLFDESFPVGEDSELFARLKKRGISIELVNDFPVIHSPTISWKKTWNRSFTYGYLQMKILYKYGRENLEDINTRNLNSNKINPISNRIRIIFGNIVFLLGLVVGSIYYLPLMIFKKPKN